MTCRRVWEAEAIEDGRLDAPSAASFERHLAACTDCTRALAALGSMREAGRRIELRRSSPLEHRRRRAELLRRANVQALRSPGFPTFRLFVAAVLAAVLAGFGYRYQSRVIAARSFQAGGIERTLPSFELRPIGTAVWHDVSSLASGRIVLSSGTLAVHVEHLRPGQRFVVAVPDGELEVHGTRFIVEARNGRTERVLVTEGIVALRLDGTPVRSLVAGESYLPSNVGPGTEPPGEAAPEPGPSVRTIETKTTTHGATSQVTVARRAPVANSTAMLPSTAGTAIGHLDANTTSAGAETMQTAPEGPPVPASADAPVAPKANGAVPDGAAGDAFHTAMAAYATGSYAEADERFAEFVGHFPTDSRCEDAAFLRTVIALRRGDPAGALARARTYLRRFPNGFRRDEVEKMVRVAGSGQSD